MGQEKTYNMSLDEVYELVMELLISCGATEDNAAPVAESIMQAEADLIRNIGLGYLPKYLEHLKCGKVDGKATPVVTQSAPSAIKVDAKSGFAHPAIKKGMGPLIEITEQNGIGAMGIGNSYAAGVLGHIIEPLAERGLMAMMFANAPAVMAPWGGKTPVFGTNPMAAAIPSNHRPPVVIDQASSVTAKVSIFDRAKSGKLLEPGWAIDKEGNPTLDPHEALAGCLLPFGGYKGAGLALLVELFSVALTGSTWSFNASSFADNEGGPPNVGQFIFALKPTLYGNENLLETVEEVFTKILDQEGTQLPCDERLQARKKTASEGVVIDQALMAKLNSYKRKKVDD